VPRKIVDCRDVPSESGCTLAIAGEEDEVMAAAVAHAVAVHGHTDDAGLRDGIRAGLRDAPMDTAPGAFVQAIEFRIDDLEQWDRAADQWLRDIGPDRTARWFVLGADRDRPGTYVEFVEFPSYEDAMTNSKHPATAAIAERMTAMADGEVGFRNLDIVRTHMP
jgi:predicted small metal-binding protein